MDFVIRLTMKHGTMFWMGRPDWDDSRFTYDIAKARRFRSRGKAEQVVRSFPWWRHDRYEPSIVPADAWFE